jgi:phospholipid transport system substrate-binding protein
MKRLIILLVALFAVPASADKPLGSGATVVKAANETISGLLKQKVAPGSKEETDLAAKVTTSVRGFLDIDELGKRAMADQWAKLTAAQQKEFLDTLRSLIEDNYVKGLRANLAYTVNYVSEAPEEGNLLVVTNVVTMRHGKQFTIEVDYVLKKDADGKLRAYDVRTDGVGLVENYRQQFNKIVDKDGFAGLIAKMKKKQQT